jgi:hypothetical protein
MSRTARWRSTLILSVIAALLTVGLSAGSTFASTASPTRSPGAPGARGPRPSRPSGAVIKAVVVKSWGQCGGGSLVWDDLNANWSSYGGTPIVIDYSDPTLCGTSFTLAALEASGANVVILSDPAGGIQQFSADEVLAVKKYAAEGHNVIGTYLTLAYPPGGIDNSALAPVFGLRAGAGYAGGDVPVNTTYSLKLPGLALFRDIPNPYVSTGFNQTQTPVDGAWSRNEKRKAKYAGKLAQSVGAITFFTNGTWDGVFITNMPEYGGGTQDKQFIYNAITLPPGG